jgi:cytochrome c oxidase subunit 3
MNTGAQKLGVDQKIYEKTKKSMLFWAMGSMFIFFSGFCSYYMVMNGNSNWLVYELPNLFYISTAVIVMSSVTLMLAQQAVKKNSFNVVKLAILSTILLGVIFGIIQFKAWAYLIEQKIFFAGKNANISGSIVYVITFMHFLHVAAGLLALIVSYFKSLKNKYTADNYLGLTLTSLFWHFLDILWLFLFLFLIFNR